MYISVRDTQAARKKAANVNIPSSLGDPYGVKVKFYGMTSHAGHHTSILSHVDATQRPCHLNHNELMS